MRKGLPLSVLKCIVRRKQVNRLKKPVTFKIVSFEKASLAWLDLFWKEKVHYIPVFVEIPQNAKATAKVTKILKRDKLNDRQLSLKNTFLPEIIKTRTLFP